MRTIELAGSVGAGKTSLVEPLRHLLAARGHEALTLGDARAHVAPQGFAWPTSIAAAARFMARHPGLVIAALRSLLRARIPGWHRRHIFMLVLRLGAELDLIAARLAPDVTVILDEGWLHRSVNLFAWRVPTPERGEITEYLDRAPLSRTIVLVDAPPGVLRARISERGLPKRLRARPIAEADAFLDRAGRVLSLAAASLAEDPRGVRLLRVVNDGLPEDLPRRLAAAIDAPSSARARPHVQAWPSLPRPDRLLRRLLASRRAGSPEPSILRAAADGFALPEPVRFEPVASPGGRGTVFALRDAAGDRWLLKRYKTGLDDRDIAVEHAVLRRLDEIGFRAPRLRSGPSGATMVHLDDTRLALFELAVGHQHPHERMFSPPDRRRLEEQAGAWLGDLHQALCGFEPPAASDNGFSTLSGPRVRPVGWFTERLELLAASAMRSDRQRREVAQAAGWISSELERIDALLEAAAPTRTVIHGDYGPYNLMLKVGRTPLIIDFELARIDWRLTDVATAIPRFAQRRTGFDGSAARRFLAGYRARTAIEPGELALLPAVAEYLALRRTVVCWDRHAAAGAGTLFDQGRERLVFARAVASAAHPLARLVGG
ncbi:MAG: phosphotransferase enzyme family protein [Candidatus Limnocylindria bacterium]